MAFFPQEFLEELNDKLDIVDVVSDYVTLKSSGRGTYMGLCPFHREKTPSFSVNADKKVFYCFGCQAGGNLIGFVQRVENLDFQDTVKLLAERANMPLPESSSSGHTVSQDEKRRYLEANRLAAHFYNEVLYTPEGEEALAYLRKRGLDDRIIRRFGLGYSPNSYNALADFMHQKGFSNTELFACGLCAVSDHGARDFFRNRVMFPIVNTNGDVIAFGGRVMDKTEPKYLNTGDTPVFNKRKNLYGINIIKKNGSKRAILCEGYMDVISLNANGFDYAVASLGTALTRDQIKLVHRFSPELYVSYDGDRAGIAATHKAIDTAREEKVVVKVIFLKDAKDPDEYMQKLGVQAYADAMSAARPGADFLISEALSGEGGTDEEKSRMAYNASIAAAKYSFDALELEMYLRRISTATGFSLESLYRNIGQSPSKQAMAISKTVQPLAPKTVKKKSANGEKQLLRLLCEHPYLCRTAEEQGAAELFTDDFRSELYTLICKSSDGKPVTLSDISAIYAGDAEKSRQTAEIFIDNTDFINPAEYCRQCIIGLKKEKLTKERAELRERLDAYTAQTISLTDDELRALVRMITEKDGEIAALKIDNI